MNREEKNKNMKMNIIKSAMIEFNKNDYENTSLNHICQIGHISKGIIYHYFNDKDELYLECVRLCFRAMVEYYEKYIDHLDDIQSYMELRFHFFEQFPEYKGMFFHLLFRSPQHLNSQIQDIKTDYDNLNRRFYHNFLSHNTLRKNIQIDHAIEYMLVMQDMFNHYLRDEANNDKNLESLISYHESLIPQWIDFMLYGLVKEEE